MILMRKVKGNNLYSSLLLAVLTCLLLVQYTPPTDGARTSNFLNLEPLPLLAPAHALSSTMHGKGNSTDDDLLSNDKRKTPTGPNPLHN
ncbi:hypothetical protein FCM35_KLT02043 [Carex littledalei]|uniref:Uncharacterized protein n=1 Tax=Carex littledalei TaxID=544730 RepID=A0A833RA29_9POAL|nr:hypothetical protein FCM35_KLT02043 [Carex littledalei]